MVSVSRYKFEIFFFCISMNDLGLTGGDATVIEGGPDVRDLCSSDLVEGASSLTVLDGNRVGEHVLWMFCETWQRHWLGVGQFYRVQVAPDRSSHRWVCIAGGNTIPK